MSAVFRRNPKVEESPLQGDLMLFDPERSQFFVLNSTMAFLWRHCDGHATLEHMVASIGNEFAESDAHPVSADMTKALDELVSLGLVAAH